MRTRWWAGVVAGAFALCVVDSASAQNVAKVGDKMSYSWQKPLVNSLGVKSLADLQGRPVVVEFWGTH